MKRANRVTPITSSATHSPTGGKSIAGLRAKKPSGRSMKPMDETGITGQSSMRGTCMCENTYHTTTSVFATLRGAFTFGQGKLTQLVMLAQGDYWGTGPFTMEPPEGKFPLAIAFRLADGSDIADDIPPHASRGWLDGYLHPER